MNSIKILLNYSENTLLEQKIAALDLSIIENRIKTLISLKLSKIFVKFETYFELTNYIKQYIHYYAIIFRSLQNLKTVLLKSKSVKVDAKRKVYTFNIRLLLTTKEKKSFYALQKAINKAFIVIHFDSAKSL